MSFRSSVCASDSSSCRFGPHCVRLIPHCVRLIPRLVEAEMLSPDSGSLLNFLFGSRFFPHYFVSFPLPETSREVMLVGEYAHNCAELHRKASICVRQNVLLPRHHSLRGPDSDVVILPQLS